MRPRWIPRKRPPFKNTRGALLRQRQQQILMATTETTPDVKAEPELPTES
jgi:hypothetical protein